MGWYASYDGSIRSKGTMYFVVHPHRLNMSGRWVGLGYDDQIMTGFAAMAHSREESEAAMARLIHSGGGGTPGTEGAVRSRHHRPPPQMAGENQQPTHPRPAQP